MWLFRGFSTSREPPSKGFLGEPGVDFSQIRQEDLPLATALAWKINQNLNSEYPP